VCDQFQKVLCDLSFQDAGLDRQQSSTTALLLHCEGRLAAVVAELGARGAGEEEEGGQLRERGRGCQELIARCAAEEVV